MVRKAVDNLELSRWRSLAACELLPLLAEYVKQDPTYRPTTSVHSTRWHATARGREFEILCTGPKFFDTRTNTGGAGAVDMAMHLLRLSFLQAIRLLRERGV